jgi:lysophospholipase L1-like esterase
MAISRQNYIALRLILFKVMAGWLLLFLLGFFSLTPLGENSKEKIKDQAEFILQRQIQNYVAVLNERKPQYLRPIKIKKDSKGHLWVFEATGPGETRFYRLSSSGGLEKNYFFKINLGAANDIREVDFCFDDIDEPYFVWLEHDEKFDRLKMASGSFPAMLVAQGPSHSLYSPVICSDFPHSLWVFWVEVKKGLSSIFYRRLIYGEWGAIEKIKTETSFPVLHPSAQADASGRTWIAWSAYDGEDYEIYVACFGGSSWSGPQKITENESCDLFPRLISDARGNLLLFWVRGAEEVQFLCLELLSPKSVPRPVWSSISLPVYYEPLIFDKEIGIVFQGKDFRFSWIKLNSDENRLDWPQRTARRSSRLNTGNTSSQAPLFFPGRDDDAYIAFGDSITTGIVVLNLDPEIYYYDGYPYRLEYLLRQSFGTGKVINEGRDGELTFQGLSRLDSVLNKYQARYLLLMEGFNDVIFSDIPVETIVFNLSEMATKAIRAGVLPALATTSPRRDAIWNQKFYRDRYLYLNDRIRQLAPQIKVPLVDMYQAFVNYPLEDGGLLSLLSVDRKHPNEKGYQYMASVWFEEIKSFPFPPKNLRIYGRDFVWDIRFIRLFGSSFPSPFMSGAETPKGNLIAWDINPKMIDLSKLAGFYIYRKKSTEADNLYVLIGLVKDRTNYFDCQLMPGVSYDYLISAFRLDGVEGPCHGPVSR